MMSAKALRDAAAILLAQADVMEGKNPGTYYGERLGEIMEVWRKLIAQYQAEDANVDSEREIGAVVTAYKPVIDAAQRERWISNLGGSFWLGNYKTASELKVAIFALMQTEEYKRWAAHPLNAHLVPNAPPTV